MDIVNDIAWHSFLFFLWIGSVLAVLVGAGLVFAPAHVERINRFFGRWIDTRHFEMEIDRPRSTERYVYRHHRIAGAIFFLGASIVLYRFLLSPAKERMARLLAPDMFGLFDAGIAFLVITNVCAAMIGLIVFFRPSMLREFEQQANRWISTEGVARVFNKPQFVLDQYVLAHPRLVGLVLIVGGGGVSFLLGKLLLLGQWHL